MGIPCITFKFIFKVGNKIETQIMQSNTKITEMCTPNIKRRKYWYLGGCRRSEAVESTRFLTFNKRRGKLNSKTNAASWKFLYGADL